MTRTRIATIALCGVLIVAGPLAGCATSGGAVPGSSQTGSSAPAGAPSLSLTRTGGFAGVNQSIEIAPDGSWTYTDHRSGATSTGQLTATQLAQFAPLALDPRLAQEARQTATSACNDAFQYALMVESMTATFSDCGRSRPALQAMLAFVTENTAF